GYPGQPDNDGTGEDAMEFDAKLGNWWNDFPGQNPTLHGYIVEFEPSVAVTPAPTPVPASSTQLVLLPNPALGGQPALGQVVLSQPVGPGGVVVTLSSSSPAVVVPAMVTVPAGASSATCVIITLPV